MMTSLHLWVGVDTCGCLSLSWHEETGAGGKGYVEGKKRVRGEVLSDYTCTNLVEACLDSLASAGLEWDVGLRGCEVMGEGCLTRLHWLIGVICYTH